MTPERWEKLKDIFDVAVDADSSDYARIIAERCGDDEELAAEARRLIQNHRTQSNLFRPIAYISPSGGAPRQGLKDGAIVANRYRVIRLLGRGGMGEVYEAEDTHVGERVALKTILAATSVLPGAAERFTRELRVARRVSHRNVCRVHDIVTDVQADGEILFYTMELLQGETLASRLRREGPLPPDLAVEIASQLAAGLDAIHAAGIIHRDLKTSNVFIEQTGGSVRAVITDFGLARGELAGDETSTALMGTPDYMAPEVLEGANATAAADLYAYGVILYEVVTGSVPFQASSPFVSALQRLRQPAPSPRLLAPATGVRWEAVILRCLDRDPKRRFHSAQAAAAVLRGEKMILPRWMHARLGWIAAALLLVAIVAGANWINRMRLYRPPPEAAVWFDKALHARNAGDYFTAAKQLERAVAIDDKFSVAHALLADCYAAQDYGERAREEMLRAHARANATRLDETDLLRIQAVELMLLREYSEAAKKYEELARRVPAVMKASVQLEVGRALDQAEKTQPAIDVFSELARANPSDAASRTRLAILLSRAGDAKGAEANFTRAREIYEADGNLAGTAEVALHQSRALILANRIDAGEALLRRAMDVASAADSPWLKIRAILQLGVAARRKGDAAAARQRATEGIALAREHDMDYAATAGMLDLGNTFLQYRDYDDADMWFQNALKIARDRKDQRSEARALASLASLRLTQHRAAEAGKLLGPALEYYTRGNYRRETAMVMIIAALVREQAGDIAGAEAVLKKNVELARSASGAPAQLREAHGRLAALQVRREDYPKALENFTLAESAAPDQPPDGGHFVNRAMALWRLGRVPEASAALARAAALAESQKNIRARVRWLTAAMDLSAGNFDRAVAGLNRNLADLPASAQAERIETEALLGTALQLQGKSSGWPLCRGAAQQADTSGDVHITASVNLLAASTAERIGDRKAAAIHAAAAQSAAARLGRIETQWRACVIEVKLKGSGSCDVFADQLSALWGQENFQRVVSLAPPGTIQRY